MSIQLHFIPVEKSRFLLWVQRNIRRTMTMSPITLLKIKIRTWIIYQKFRNSLLCLSIVVPFSKF